MEQRRTKEKERKGKKENKIEKNELKRKSNKENGKECEWKRILKNVDKSIKRKRKNFEK